MSSPHYQPTQMPLLPATLSEDEIYALTRATQPAAQLRRLVAAGFARARIERGHVVLERPHYIAVSGGNATEADKPRPTIRKVGRFEPA